MAKLQTVPDNGTIIASRGKLDFYLWKGIPVCRAWPVYRPYERSEAEIDSTLAFTAAAKMTGAIGGFVAQAFREQQVGLGVTWVDHFRAMARGKPWIEPVEYESA